EHRASGCVRPGAREHGVDGRPRQKRRRAGGVGLRRDQEILPAATIERAFRGGMWQRLGHPDRRRFGEPPPGSSANLRRLARGVERKWVATRGERDRSDYQSKEYSGQLHALASTGRPTSKVASDDPFSELPNRRKSPRLRSLTVGEQWGRKPRL